MTKENYEAYINRLAARIKKLENQMHMCDDERSTLSEIVAGLKDDPLSMVEWLLNDLEAFYED